MILPLRRDALKQKAAVDEQAEAELYEHEPPERRLLIGLRLSELTRKLARAAGADWILEPPDDLAEKARLYVMPLRKACRP